MKAWMKRTGPIRIKRSEHARKQKNYDKRQRKEIGMKASPKKLKSVSVLLTLLIAALAVGTAAKTAQCRILQKQRLSTCTGNETNDIGDCTTHLEITLAVSYGLRSLIDVLGPDQVIRDGEVYSLVQGVQLKTTKTQPTVTYPLTYFHTVAYSPYEEVIRVQNSPPGTQACVDDPAVPDSPGPT